jgi:hypothetical protein
MGQQLISYFQKIEMIGGLKGKMRLAMISGIPSSQATTLPDEPDKVVKMKEAFDTVSQEFE